MNIVQLIDRQAQVRPGAIALIGGARAIRFRQLARAINNLATHLAAQGIAPGDCVGVAMDQSSLHLILLLALARLRAVCLPAHALHPAATRKSIVDHFRPVTIACHRAKDGVEGCSELLVDPGWLRKPAEATLPPIAPADVSNEVCRFSLSSGTTGLPKGIVRTHGDTLNQVLFQASAFRCDSKTRFLCVMDFNTSASLNRLLSYLASGSTVIIAESPGWDAVQTVLAETEPVHTLLSPGLLGRWLRDLGDRRASCPALTHLSIVGGRLQHAMWQRASRQITPHIFTCYGSTEAGLTALQYPDDPRRERDSVGRIVPWAEVEVIDPDGRPLSPGKQGRLRFRGIGFATSYYENPEATAKAFRDGWFYPGDIGRVSVRGSLFVAAREDDMLNIQGQKIDLSESEGVLAAHPAVAEVAAFRVATATGEAHLVAAVVTRTKIDAGELLKYSRDKLGARAPHLVVPVRELPRDAMGKVARRDLARDFAALRITQ